VQTAAIRQLNTQFQSFRPLPTTNNPQDPPLMGVARTGDRHLRRKIFERGSLKCGFSIIS
jgi:hypothetical protein